LPPDRFIAFLIDQGLDPEVSTQMLANLLALLRLQARAGTIYGWSALRDSMLAAQQHNALRYRRRPFFLILAHVTVRHSIQLFASVIVSQVLRKAGIFATS
jgi:hypothetical protein